MKLSFWMHFIITTGVGLAEAFVAGNSKLNDAQKAALEKFIEDGNALLATFI